MRSLGLFMRFVPSESQRVFILTLVIGAVSGLAAVSFHLAIIECEKLLIEPAISAPGGSGYLMLVLVPTLGGLVSGIALYYVVPGARGSGIPQVKVAYSVKGGRLPLRDVIGKFAIGVLQIGSGASLGREGPTVHICAGIATNLGRTFALSQKNVKRLLPVGVAAGIAAAFNAPIAAVTFTIEEIVGDLDQTVLSGVIVAAAIAAAIERGILGEHPVFTITESYGLNYGSSLLFYAILGIAAGGISLAFSESLLQLRSLFRKFERLPGWAQPAIGGIVTGLLILTALYFFQTAGINGGGYETLSAALAGKLAVKVMAVLCLLKLAATVFSYSSGGAGGIFAPSLFVGGMLGGVIGVIDVNLLQHPSNEVGAFALVGMGAVFAGVVRAPITSILIIFEMTGSYGLILPLMIANMTSYALARRFRPVPIYEALLEQDNIFLPHPGKMPAHPLERIRVSDAMITDVVTLWPSMTAASAFEMIQQYEITTFPVIDDSSACVGVITELRLRRTVASGRGELTIGELADRCSTVYPDHLLDRALYRMNKAAVRQLSVVERSAGHRFVGIIAMADIIRVQAEAIGAKSAGDAPDAVDIHSTLAGP
ncbi:MAG: chloride channel protein [Acidobacteriota bacterium]